MSLYHEAVEILDTARRQGGSIKSIVFTRKDWKSDSKTLFALATETAKWSEVLSEIIETSGILQSERQLTPVLALVLVHDLLLAKKGIALPPKHGLAVALKKHKARLSAELTKARLRRALATLEELKTDINGRSTVVNNVAEQDNQQTRHHPRWIRINTLRTSREAQLKLTFALHERTSSLYDVVSGDHTKKLVYVDQHVPNLVAVSPKDDITSSLAYKQGHIILQDKASCFPACLLDPGSSQGDMIDACAAPGNKTTHLAALISASATNRPQKPVKRKIIACERDHSRSATLATMVKTAGADVLVRVKADQDFSRLDPGSSEVANVTAILLDPSCSGSGIVGRDGVLLNLHLPKSETSNGSKAQSKKRKRDENRTGTTIDDVSDSLSPVMDNEGTAEYKSTIPEDFDYKLGKRLSALAGIQLKLLQHAMAFPVATRITYSTCSVYNQENEEVVTRALGSQIATDGGWRILKRDEQVEGMRKWHMRGDFKAVRETRRTHFIDTDEAIAEGCIRCEKGGEDGTMGFFVAGLVRDRNAEGVGGRDVGVIPHLDPPNGLASEETDDEEWRGFSDGG